MRTPDAAKRTDSDAGMWVEDEMKIQNHKDAMPRNHEQKSELPRLVTDVDPRDPMNWPLWLKASMD